jgi:hypothetical protein
VQSSAKEEAALIHIDLAIIFACVLINTALLFTRRGRRVYTDWAAVLKSAVGITAPPAPIRPHQLPAREPRDHRQGLDPDDPANALLLETCPVCGMHESERFELGVGVAKWHGWPAHETCLAWLGEQPSEKRQPVAFGIHQVVGGQVPLYVRERAEPVSWTSTAFEVTPAGGMMIEGRRRDGTGFLMQLFPADPLYPRTDAICRDPDQRGGVTGYRGEPSPLALPPVLPAGAEVIAWIHIPRACTQICPALIRVEGSPA